MKALPFLALAGTLALTTTAFAQTVTVAKTGTPTYNTIAAAIAHFTPDPDGGAANVIQITDNAVYKEVVTVNVPVTIEGTNPADRPTIVASLNSGSAGDGILISVPTGTSNNVTLRNLICLPDPAAPVTDDLIISVGQNLNLLFENILVTANNGSDAPVTVDGLTNPSVVGATVIGDDGIFVGGTAAPAGDGTVATLRDVVISKVTGDGLVCSGTGKGYTVEDGCVFSFNGRLGIQGNADFEINAPTDRALLLGNAGFAAIWFGGGTVASTGTERRLSGVNVLNNTGFGIEQQNGFNVPFILENAIIAGNGTIGLAISEVGTAGANTISNVTIANNGGAPISTHASSTSAVTITDSIIAGPNTQITHNGTGTMAISDSAVVTQGTLALLAPGYTGTGTVTLTNVISDAPIFISTDFTQSTFYDVDNPAYVAAGTGGTNLAGGADYVGSFTEPTSATGWNVYE